jgi:hypothetical protein
MAVASNKSADVLQSSSLRGRRPDMWYDPTVDLVYSMGSWSYGLTELYNPNVVPTMWGFKPQSNGNVNWSSQSSTINPQSAALSSNIQGGLAATSPTGHYNLGGCFWDGQNNFTLGEMFSYNSANQSWYNLTLTMPEQHFIAGQAQYIPIYGASGVILFFGGYWETPSSLAGLDTILIYDIHTNRFFKQPASTPPLARSYFCSVAAVASNNESYEMCVSPSLEYHIHY